MSDPDQKSRHFVDPSNRDAVIHVICPYLRNYEKCRECPEWEIDEVHGPLKQGCYFAAQEVMNICQTGNPWRKKPHDA